MEAGAGPNALLGTAQAGNVAKRARLAQQRRRSALRTKAAFRAKPRLHRCLDGAEEAGWAKTGALGTRLLMSV